MSVFFYCGTDCPFEAYLVNPSGLKIGIDAETGGKFNEIPNAEYYGPCVGGCDADKVISIGWAESGDYLLVVSNRILKMAIYRMEVTPYDSSGFALKIPIKNIRTGLNSVTKFLLHTEGENIRNSSISGGFDGGGQRPKDVNKFLTYANPSDSQTDLPAGTTTFPLMIFYGNSIITSTFKASLNGVDITSLFNPIPASHETVNLPLSPGRNVLSLSTDGNLPTRVATDNDRLVFIVK